MMTARWLPISALLFVCAVISSGQERPPSAVGSYSIRGVVVSAKTGKPLDRTEVTLSNDQFAKIADTITAEDGTFAFENVKAGSYPLLAARRGYNAARYDEHEGFFSSIVTGPGLDTTHLLFALLPQAIIAGAVTDDAGEPVRNAQVMLYRKSSFDGLGKITQAASRQTDDTGAFEFPRLSPGDYFVSVSATPWYASRPQPVYDGRGNLQPPDSQAAPSPLDVAYPLTFYADATGSDDATPIPVRAGDRVQLSFSLHAVPALHLRFRVAEGQKQMTVWPQLTQSIFGEQQPMNMTNMMNGNGVVEMAGVAPGRYDIRFFGRGGQGGEITGADLTSDATFDSPPAEAGVEILGKLTMLDGEELPFPMGVALRNPARTKNYGAQVAKDGTFKLEGVRQGTYELEVGGPRGAFFLARLAADGASIEGQTIKVGSGPVNLAAVVTPDSATVSGYAKQNGKGVSGVMVVLVPRDPAANRELFRRDQSNSDGSFQLRRVAPGAYTIVAIQDGWQLDWGRPEVIDRYLAHGLEVKVGPAERNIVENEAVDIQPR